MKAFLIVLILSLFVSLEQSQAQVPSNPTYQNLTIQGGRIALGRWSTGSEPASPQGGWFGYNQTDNLPEYYNGTAWIELGGGSTFTGTNCLVGVDGTVGGGVPYCAGPGGIAGQYQIFNPNAPLGSLAGALLNDDPTGTYTFASGPIDLTGFNLEIDIQNDSTTGSTINQLGALSGASVIATAAAGSNQPVIGVVQSGSSSPSTTGKARVAIGGQASCIFDGAITTRHLFGLSASVAGDCTDLGSQANIAALSGVTVYGIILAPTNAAPGSTPQTVLWQGPNYRVGVPTTQWGNFTLANCGQAVTGGPNAISCANSPTSAISIGPGSWLDSTHATPLSFIDYLNINTTCSGTVTAGSTSCTVGSTAHMVPGAQITIAGAGVSGANLAVEINSIAGTTVGWVGATSTTVTNAAVAGTGACVVDLGLTGHKSGQLDAGTVATSTWYAIYVIGGSTGGTGCLATLETAGAAPNPTLPSGFTLSIYVGSLVTKSASAIPAIFVQQDDEFFLGTAVLDINDSTLTTSRKLYTMTAPLGVKVRPMLYAQGNASHTVLIGGPDEQPDVAPSTNGAWAAAPGWNVAFVTTAPVTIANIYTNTSGQIFARSNGASTTLAVMNQGWLDKRPH